MLAWGQLNSLKTEIFLSYLLVFTWKEAQILCPHRIDAYIFKHSRPSMMYFQQKIYPHYHVHFIACFFYPLYIQQAWLPWLLCPFAWHLWEQCLSFFIHSTYNRPDYPGCSVQLLGIYGSNVCHFLSTLHTTGMTTLTALSICLASMEAMLLSHISLDFSSSKRRMNIH